MFSCLQDIIIKCKNLSMTSVDGITYLKAFVSESLRSFRNYVVGIGPLYPEDFKAGFDAGRKELSGMVWACIFLSRMVDPKAGWRQG